MAARGAVDLLVDGSLVSPSRKLLPSREPRGFAAVESGLLPVPFAAAGFDGADDAFDAVLAGAAGAGFAVGFAGAGLAAGFAGA